MSRRASLPGAAELFRATSPAEAEPDNPAPVTHPGVGAIPPVREVPPPVERFEQPEHSDPISNQSLDSAPRSRGPSRSVRQTRRMRAVSDRAPSGRERHEEKITVY